MLIFTTFAQKKAKKSEVFLLFFTFQPKKKSEQWENGKFTYTQTKQKKTDITQQIHNLLQMCVLYKTERGAPKVPETTLPFVTTTVNA